MQNEDRSGEAPSPEKPHHEKIRRLGHRKRRGSSRPCVDKPLEVVQDRQKERASWCLLLARRIPWARLLCHQLLKVETLGCAGASSNSALVRYTLYVSLCS